MHSKAKTSVLFYTIACMTLALCLLALPQKTLAEQTSGDAVHLKDGSIIHGAIIRLSLNDVVTIQIVGGNQLNFSMNHVKKVTMSVVRSGKDVVYLKDKSMIHGAIVRFIPDESLLIQTRSGNRYDFRMDEVSKVNMDRFGQSRPVTRKSAGLATGLSIIMPGLGQFYNGQFKKGFTFAGIHIGSVVSVMMLDETDYGIANALASYLAIGFFVNWGVSPCDAWHSARATNPGLDRQSQLTLSPITTSNRIGVLVSRRF